MLKWLWSFIKDVARYAWIQLYGIWANREAVAILVLAAVGLSALLVQLPFTVAVPFEIERLISTPMVVPLFSTFVTWLLVKTMAWRKKLYETN